MTPDEAKKLLQAHSGRDAETDPSKWENGFFCTHRSTPDDCNEGNFLEIMQCIKVLANEIASSASADRELMAALWGIAFCSRMYAFNPRQIAALHDRRLYKLNGAHLSRLADQLDRIAEAVEYALNGMPDSVEDAMIEYGEPLPDYIAALNTHA